mgnify:CR=1 FL=1|tara:strand:+ start:795 stop:2045 length:1251 start_codon:yes stop_codon:yes gene_type:complete
MNKFYSVLSVLLMISSTAIGQCENDYDFGDVGFGVSPDPVLGETFTTGTVNQDYYDVLNLLVPAYAADVDEIYPPQLLIDSLEVVSVSFTDTVTLIVYTPEMLGLEVVCNNNGDSGNPCSFLGGLQYCATIQGIPNTSGVFKIDISIIGWLTIAEVFSVTDVFENFILNIHCNLIESTTVVDADGDAGTLGSIDITLLDGVVADSFAWTNADGLLVGTTEDLENVSPGIYSLTIVADGCTSYFENILVVDSSIICEMVATYEVTDVSDTSLGHIDLTVTDINGSATYTWTDVNGVIVGTDEDLSNVAVGDYTIVIIDEDGCVLIIEDISVVVNSIDNIDILNLIIAPNPSSSSLSITVNYSADTYYSVYDVQGKEVLSDNFIQTTSLDVSSWEEGVYSLKFSNSLGTATHRVLVQR